MNGRIFAGARALYRAAGVDGKDFGKPIVAIANSFDEFVPGHVHLNKVGRLVSEAVKQAGGIPREFNTMAVDDGIAMGHTGMLYSLPSREIIADTVEYQVNAHCADALICISNCDKITPGMLMAALRHVLKAKRHRRGSIDFDVPEVKVKLDDKGHPVALIKREGSLAESIIEECMLIANETVARHMDTKQQPFM